MGDDGIHALRFHHGLQAGHRRGVDGAGFTQGLRRGVVSKLEALLKEHFPVDLLDRRPQVAGFFPGHHVQSPLLHLRRFSATPAASLARTSPSSNACRSSAVAGRSSDRTLPA